MDEEQDVTVEVAGSGTLSPALLTFSFLLDKGFLGTPGWPCLEPSMNPDGVKAHNPPVSLSSVLGL